MPAISPKELVRFTPEAMKENEDAPVFILKTPSLRDKIALDACLAIEGVRYPPNTEYAAALRDGIRESVLEEEQPDLVAIVTEYEALAEEGIAVPPDLMDKVEQIARTLRPFYRPLAQVDSDRGRFLALAMLVRAEMFLVNIEGENAPKIEKRNGRLTEQCVDAIEKRYGSGTLFGIGARTVDLTNPTEEEKKVSDLPAPLPPDPEITTVDPKLQTGRRGKSLDRSTNEIPA